MPVTVELFLFGNSSGRCSEGQSSRERRNTNVWEDRTIQRLLMRHWFNTVSGPIRPWTREASVSVQCCCLRAVRLKASQKMKPGLTHLLWGARWTQETWFTSVRFTEESLIYGWNWTPERRSLKSEKKSESTRRDVWGDEENANVY